MGLQAFYFLFRRVPPRLKVPKLPNSAAGIAPTERHAMLPASLEDHHVGRFGRPLRIRSKMDPFQMAELGVTHYYLLTKWGPIRAQYWATFWNGKLLRRKASFKGFSRIPCWKRQRKLPGKEHIFWAIEIGWSPAPKNGCTVDSIQVHRGPPNRK